MATSSDIDYVELQRAYPGEYVALSDGEILDHDPDIAVLGKRVSTTYGKTRRWELMFVESPDEAYVLVALPLP